MKKKTPGLKKLSFTKSAVISLNGSQQGQAMGGANTEVGTGPCGPCNYTHQVSCIYCVSTNTACGQTEAHGCVATGGMVTVCNIC